MNFLQRTESLLTKKQILNIKKSNICVFGCGGVGGYVIEMFVRSGVNNLTVVDFDKVEITNLNRQIIATTKTIGEQKVDVVAERSKSINPKIKIKTINEKFCAQTINKFKLKNFDYIVDCIDNTSDKLLLIKLAIQLGVPIISAMGAGNKIEIPDFKICDIYKTNNDGLAKKMRKLLREEGVKKLDVCCCDQKSLSNKKVGSIAYYPAMAGCLIASYVINKIIKEK